MGRSPLGWRLPVAIVLVVVNAGLVAANLDKHDLFPFSEEPVEDVVSGDTTASSSTPTSEATTAATEAATEVEEEPDVDDWPGGRGPVPEGPPEPRRVLLSADGTAQIIGSAPDWATAMQVANYVAGNLGVDQAAVSNELRWHPDAATDVQSGNVLIEQAATFSLGQSEIAPESLPTLDFVANLLNTRPSLFAVVIGHTDNVGDEQLNAELAFTRASAVVDYLVGRGVIPGQLVVASAGEDAPVASNDTPEGRQFNRRIELQFKNFLVPPGEIG